jgi:hypothetical protein
VASLKVVVEHLLKSAKLTIAVWVIPISLEPEKENNLFGGSVTVWLISVLPVLQRSNALRARNAR